MPSFTLSELALQVNAQVRGELGRRIYRIATLRTAGTGDIAFLSNHKYRKQLQNTKADAVILALIDSKHCPVPMLLSDNPYVCYARVARLLNPLQQFSGAVHPSAVIGERCQIHQDAWIGPNCTIGSETKIEAGAYLGPGCQVGKQCHIGHGSRLLMNVSLGNSCLLGARVLIHSGAVIGSDGFGFAKEEEKWIKIPQLGRVRLGQDVEIGANTTIDRGALEDTVIEDGVKIDNQVQIAHNVVIGTHTAIAACVGIAGSTRIGKNCTIAGAAGIIGHLEIVDGVHITAMTLVTKSIRKAGSYSSGTPLQANRLWKKNAVRAKQLDEMMQRIKNLESLVEHYGKDRC